MRFRYLVIGLALMVALCGCGTVTPEEVTEGAQSASEGETFMSPVSPISPVSPPPTPVMVSPLPSPLPDADAEAMVATLLPLVAERLGVEAEELQVVRMEKFSFSDTSLDCPQPGMMYAQVITSGWKVMLKDAEGNQYDLRLSDENPGAFIICEQGGDSSSLPPREPGESEQAVFAARALVAERIEGLTPDMLSLVSVEFIEWPDGCLGCPEPGLDCTEAIVPGYRVVLQSGDALYEVHTDLDGTTVVLCEDIASL